MTDIVMESAFSSYRDSTGADESAGSADHSLNQNTGGAGDDSANITGNTSAAQEKKITGFEVSFFRLKQSDWNGLVLDPKANITLIVGKYNSKCATEGRIAYVAKNWGEITSDSVPEFEYYFEVHVQTSTCQNPLLARYQIEEKVTNQNTVIFYCINDSLYAVTQRQGYRLIERYIDYEFPTAVARRLLDEKGRIKHNSVNLYGKAFSSGDNYRKEIPTKLLDFQICIEFYARLRSDASIRSLKCFGKRDIKVNIGLGKVRFVTKIDPKYYPDIIYRLDRIQDRLDPGMTYTTVLDNKKMVPTLTEEKDSESFTNFFQKVGNYKQLNSDLTESIRQYILGSDSNDTRLMDTSAAQPMVSSAAQHMDTSAAPSNTPNQLMICLDNFYVCHKDYDDFSRGTDFKLVFKERKHKFKTTPTLKEVLVVLKEWNQTEWTEDGKRQSVLNTKDSESFEKDLFKVNLSFSISEKPAKPTSLLNCIEGEMMKDQYYWRRRRIWYYISADYLKFIHKEFQNIINDNWVSKTESGHLAYKGNPVWSLAVHEEGEKKGEEIESENDYCRKFKEGQFKDNYLCLDGIETKNGLELMDIMFSNKNKTLIYHVKQGFAQGVRVACSQLRNSAEFIKKAITVKNSNTEDILKDYYQQICVAYKEPNTVPEFVKSFEEFRNILIDPKPTFVYAFAMKPENGLTKSLFKELDVKYEITRQELNQLYTEYVKKLKKEKIAEEFSEFMGKVIKGMVSDNYLRKKDSDYEVTSKLLFCSDQCTFNLSCFDGHRNKNKLIKKIFSKYRSQYKTVGAMMDVIHLRNEIEDKGIGYDFKICEFFRKKVDEKPNKRKLEN